MSAQKWRTSIGNISNEVRASKTYYTPYSINGLQAEIQGWKTITSFHFVLDSLILVSQGWPMGFYIHHVPYAELDLMQLPALQHLSVDCEHIPNKIESSSLKSLTFLKKYSSTWSDSFLDLDLPRLSKLTVQYSAEPPSEWVCFSSLSFQISSSRSRIWFLHVFPYQDWQRQSLTLDSAVMDESVTWSK